MSKTKVRCSQCSYKETLDNHTKAKNHAKTHAAETQHQVKIKEVEE